MSTTISFIIFSTILTGYIWALINIRQSIEDENTKFNWILILVLLPVIGLFIWYIGGPRRIAGTWHIRN